MHLLTIGLNHRTAPVEIRERLSFSESGAGEASSLIVRRGIGAEAAVLSTCNRSEIYIVPMDEKTGFDGLERFLSEFHSIPKDRFQAHLYHRQGVESARHLFRVASGIDSMVLGESQILGQVRDAFHAAREAGSARLILDELFRRALNVGKRSRTETDIGRGALSVGSAAVELAHSIFGNLQGHTVLILGAGKMSELTVRHLIDSGAKSIIFSNRTFERAVSLAKQFSGRAVPFEELSEHLVHADIVIASTAAPHHVLTYEGVSHVMRTRRGRPLFLIDIAVPRDIDPRVNELDNAFLFNIDDLKGQVEQNRVEREKEIGRVEDIIDSEVQSFSSWLKHLEVRPLVAAVSKHVEEVHLRNVEEALSKLPNLSERERQIIRGMAKTIANELAHGAYEQLRNAAERGDGYLDADVIRKTFLPESHSGDDQEKRDDE